MADTVDLYADVPKVPDKYATKKKKPKEIAVVNPGNCTGCEICVPFCPVNCIEVSNPKQTYWLNHYPRVGHTIYNEDFQATIPVAGGATVVVRVVDGNDRQIDNSEPGRPDRQQIIKGVVDTPLAGQMLRLDVVRVVAR